MKIYMGYRGFYETQDNHPIETFVLSISDSHEMAQLAKSNPDNLFDAFIYCGLCEYYYPHMVYLNDFGNANAVASCPRCSKSYLLKLPDRAMTSLKEKGLILRSGLNRPFRIDGLYLSGDFEDDDGRVVAFVMRFYKNGKVVSTLTDYDPVAFWEYLEEHDLAGSDYTIYSDIIRFGPGLFGAKNPCRGFYGDKAIVIEDHPDWSEFYFAMKFIPREHLHFAR